MNPKKKLPKNKGKIRVTLDIIDALNEDQLKKLTPEQANEILEIRNKRKKST